MEKVYLDANVLIDLNRGRGNTTLATQLKPYTLFISPLSVYILFYSYKMKAPNTLLGESLVDFIIVDFTASVLEKALVGPTSDLEDNIQLHSAAESECDYFLTSDKDLLSMKFFGKMQVVNSL